MNGVTREVPRPKPEGPQARGKDPTKDRGKVLTPEIDRGKDRGKVLTPKIDQKIDHNKVFRTEIGFL